MKLLHWWSLCATLSTVVGAPQSGVRPLVLWHGLGDSHSSPGMMDFAQRIQVIHPGLFVHSVYIEEDLAEDRKAGFYGNVNEQLEFVAAQIAEIPELQNGFDAIGLSQGGQFLRAYVERYNEPPIHNLITFGSQHMGVSDIPKCRAYDLLCLAARRVARSAAYTEWAQTNLVQAQYYRDPNNLETYLTANHFLPFINNEISEQRNETYAQNFASLNTLVLLIFEDDRTVVPKESAWFGSEQPAEDIKTDNSQIVFRPQRADNIIPMRSQPLYTEDWIGLRQLDERGAVVFDACNGEHMHMGDCWERIVRQYVGGPF
ncbi:alpha/beta-hydrolase [Pluteus cervinus]|uniref:Alpha/beta-hydrolase n=1 Tax=Pluteus cervinus TaxID=181527 RepID=A0ACD3BBX3_9AGAR|nr:alpha/beta-hydrolase [Pluteus cervinus]